MSLKREEKKAIAFGLTGCAGFFLSKGIADVAPDLTGPVCILIGVAIFIISGSLLKRM